MKAFLVSLSIIGLIFALTIFNSIYINNVATSLIEEANTITLSYDSVEHFASHWERNNFLLRISSSHKETHRIDELISVLKEKSRLGADSGFYEDRALLIEYIKQIKEDETVSFDSII